MAKSIYLQAIIRKINALVQSWHFHLRNSANQLTKVCGSIDSERNEARKTFLRDEVERRAVTWVNLAELTR